MYNQPLSNSSSPKRKKEVKYASYLLLLLFLIWIISGSYRAHILNKNAVIIVGAITKFSTNNVLFKYEYKKVVYRVSYYHYPNMATKETGDKVLVMINPENPDNSTYVINKSDNKPIAYQYGNILDDIERPYLWFWNILFTTFSTIQ